MRLQLDYSPAAELAGQETGSANLLPNQLVAHPANHEF
jgi:hypothetical protein